MKVLAKTLAVVGLFSGLTGAAMASPELVAADNNVSSKICVTAATGDKFDLRSAIKDAGLTKQYVENKITCNDMPIVNFVAQYGEKPQVINDFITSGRYSEENYLASVNADQ